MSTDAEAYERCDDTEYIGVQLIAHLEALGGAA